jgi:hypothetical protein
VAVADANPARRWLIPLIISAEEESRMRKFFESIDSVSRITVESGALKSNLLGDPLVRVVDVYMPAGHDGQGLPLLVDLVGFTGSGLSHTNWVGFRGNLPERLDRLFGEQRMPPLSSPSPIASPSSAVSMGAWEDFLLHEMLPAIGFDSNADWNPIWHPTGLGPS